MTTTAGEAGVNEAVFIAESRGDLRTGDGDGIACTAVCMGDWTAGMGGDSAAIASAEMAPAEIGASTAGDVKSSRSEISPSSRGLAGGIIGEGPGDACAIVSRVSGSSNVSGPSSSGIVSASAIISCRVAPAATSAAAPRNPDPISFAAISPSSSGLAIFAGVGFRISRDGVLDDARCRSMGSPGVCAVNAGMATVAAAMSSAASNADVVVGVGRSPSTSRSMDRSSSTSSRVRKEVPSCSSGSMRTLSSAVFVTSAKRLSAGEAPAGGAMGSGSGIVSWDSFSVTFAGVPICNASNAALYGAKAGTTIVASSRNGFTATFARGETCLGGGGGMAALASASAAEASYAFAFAALSLDLVDGGVSRTVVTGTDASSERGVRSFFSAVISIAASASASSSSSASWFFDGVAEGVFISAGVNLGLPLRAAPLAIAAVAGLLADSFLTDFFLALT